METDISVPGLEHLFALAGPIVMALAGFSDGGSSWSLSEALVGIGIPAGEVRKYQTRIENGDILMSVSCSGAAFMNKAKQLFVSTGAEDISSTGELPPGWDVSGN